MSEQPEAMKLAAVIEQFGGSSAYLCAAMLAHFQNVGGTEDAQRCK